MSVVVEVTVPADSFALAHALDAEPSTTVEAERVASHSPEWALPFLWESGDDLDAFHEAMAEDPTVDRATPIEESDGEVLCRVEWCDEFLDLITEMIDKHAIILEARAQSPEWRLRLRFGDEEEVSSFREHFTERGQQFDVIRLHHPVAPRQREYGLTPTQRETLVTALEAGYFAVPRDRSITELADDLGVSSNAVSQRLRRGSGTLIERTLTIGTEADDE